MKYSLMLSTIFFICGFFYMFLGAYTLSYNAKSGTNRLYLLLAISMAVWSFTYAISNSALTAESSAFWAKLAVFGWGAFYNLFLHFILILTNSRYQPNSPGKLIVFYLPFLINVILFAPFGFLSENQYKMVPSIFGWKNSLPANFRHIFANVYYVMYIAVSVVLLIRWWRKLKPESPLKRQVTYFLLSIILPFFAGTITDVLPEYLGLTRVPRIAIVFLVIPTTFMYRILKIHGLLLEREKIVHLPLDSGISQQESRFRLFETVSAVYIAGALGSFYSGFFLARNSITVEFSLSLSVFIFGVLLRFVPYVIKSPAAQNTVFLITSLIGMSFFLITNVRTGAVTVWAVYIVILLFTVVFDSKVHAFIFYLAALSAQVVLWILYPDLEVVIDSSNYLNRTIIISLSYFAVRYLTNEYSSKLQGYQKFSKEQEVLEIISSSFISINSDNVKEKIDEMFEMSAEILGFDYAYLFEFDEEYKEATIHNMYVKDFENNSSPFSPGTKFNTADFPEIKPLIARKTPLMCEDVNNIPAELAGEQKNFFMSRGINSFFALPIATDAGVTGFFVIEYYDRVDKRFTESRLHFLRIIANTLGDAKKKILYEERLYKSAYFDTTTKLANRNMLVKNLDQVIQDKKDSGKTAVLDIKLLNLRMIKDTFGHAVGEQVMIKSAAILLNLFEECCEVARTGEGDFVVVFHNAESKEQIEGFVDSVLRSFFNPVSTESGIEELFVVVGIGVSMYPDDGRDADTLLKNADLARYEARDSDKRVVFYSPQLEDNIADNTLLTNKLFKSLSNEEFSLEFQPQVSCLTEKTVGIETLLRWTTDDNRRIPPDRFIPMLEQTGLIYDVGRWVLKQALREHNRLVEKGFPPLRVSVNLSVVQFQSDNFIFDFTKIIEESRVNPEYIELEITESLFSANPEDTIGKLYKLKELGVKIAVDDFGKGYSSLNRLKQIPFDRIKIDKEIIDNIDLHEKSAPITEVIILMARALNAGITAEGVETKEQVDFLKSMNCDEIQGFYYSKPLSPEALEEFLKKESEPSY